jgi:hypothetical protein
MTAPVQQQNNAKIAMTAPVQQQLNGDSWKVSFVMPAEYGLSTLPKPNNERVSLKNIAAKKFIVMKFSGSNSQSNISKHKNEFYRYLQKEKISSIGSPKYAYYNPPWTLPLFRRNEIMLEINR